MPNITERYSSGVTMFEDIKAGDEFQVIGHRFSDEARRIAFPIGSTVTAYEICGRCITINRDQIVCQYAVKQGHKSCPTRCHRVHVRSNETSTGVSMCALLLIDKKGRQVT